MREPHSRTFIARVTMAAKKAGHSGAHHVRFAGVEAFGHIPPLCGVVELTSLRPCLLDQILQRVESGQ